MLVELTIAELDMVAAAGSKNHKPPKEHKDCGCYGDSTDIDVDLNVRGRNNTAVVVVAGDDINVAFG